MVCNGVYSDDHCSYGYLWSWKYLSFTNYSLRSGIPVPQEHLEIKDCKIRKNGAFLCWIIDAAKRTQIFETLLCWIIEKLLLPYNPPSQTQCSSHSYCYTHSYATNCFLCLYPFLQAMVHVMLTLRGKWQHHSDRRWSARSWRSPLRTHGTSCPRNRQRSQTWNKLSLKSENFGFWVSFTGCRQ